MIWRKLDFRHFRKYEDISPYHEILEKNLILECFQNFHIDYENYFSEEENMNVVKESSMDPWTFEFGL